MVTAPYSDVEGEGLFQAVWNQRESCNQAVERLVSLQFSSAVDSEANLPAWEAHFRLRADVAMSSSLSDSYDLYYTHTFSIIAGTLLVVFYFSTLKLCFGTYNVVRAVSNFKQNKLTRERYLRLFTTRDQLMYHISWSKSRGEGQEAKRMMESLDKVDQQIDEIENSNDQLFGRSKRKPASEKVL
ncbi:hypothetical protein B484DRAFT_417666 [Ochromonadaceae sp. CCMP2298]|nr:hypothetical protein B484DRAFT_417666 [Ochromonadaceae sp. CCMP2298]